MRLRGDSTGKTDYCLCDNNYFTLVICRGKWEIIPLSLCLLHSLLLSLSLLLLFFHFEARLFHSYLNSSLSTGDET